MNIDVRTDGDLPGCHRCQGQLYLTARLPHPGFPPRAGQIGVWSRIVGLCPRCDAADAHAHALLAFFAYHPQINEGNAAEFAALVQDWISGMPPPRTVDQRTLEEEITAWRRGELDG